MLALFHGVPWIHIFPALLAVGFGFLYLQSKRLALKVLWGLLWLLFLPNTIFIITDLDHFINQWNAASIVVRLALTLQYLVLEIIGLTTFLAAFLPFERMMHVRHLSQQQQVQAILVLNFLIAFGIVLGKWEHLNSWIVFTQPVAVARSALHIVTSLDLLGLTVFLGILGNGIYFLSRRILLGQTKKLVEAI